MMMVGASFDSEGASPGFVLQNLVSKRSHRGVDEGTSGSPTHGEPLMWR